MNTNKTKKIVVLATGGTIAGWAKDVSDPQHYTAGQVAVADLLKGLDVGAGEMCWEQVAQIDSKNMSFEVWQRLLARLVHWLDQDDVAGVVITHGTDTLEETAYFLHSVVRAVKPVAMTCAMLPANAPDSDGPANLHSALEWVQRAHAPGVVVVCAGEVHRGDAVQKTNSQQRNPFTSQVTMSLPQTWRVPTVAQVLACQRCPRVELVLNYACADGRLVRALTATDPPEGWVVAGTGNGTVHQDLEAALWAAQQSGASVWRASRCASGGVQSRDADLFPHAGGLTPVQARVALMLHLISLQQP